MSDFLLELSKNPNARKLIQTLGLPIPLPQALERARGPWEERPLADRRVVVGSTLGGKLSPVLAVALASAGAEPILAPGWLDEAPFKAAGEAYGRPPKTLETAGDKPFWALVFDATGIADPAGLRALYDYFHPIIGQLGRSGRIVILGAALEDVSDPAAVAAQMALDGFIRSASKEVGRKGATANLVRVDGDAHGRVAPLLRYLLSNRAAFVTGQPIRVSLQAAPANGSDGEVPWTRPLEGKVVLVTGAARGIGAATVRLLAAEGARVVCLDRPADDAPLSQIAREIGGTPILADVSDPEAPAKIAAELLTRLGGVDVVVHNAGITRDKTLAKMKPELWDQTIDVNLGAVTRITAALTAKGGPMRDGGRIICLSSVAGIAGNMGQTNYAASKAGIIGFVRALAPKLAARGITVNAIAPGFIETRLTAAIPVVIREVGRRLSALGQGGLPEDIGQLVTFLSSPGAQGVTGQIIRDCGGALIGA
ncbi:MAG: 3-oxoacyl-[acyl-carrier protein] reductase [Myxococcales bacterium]|nr:3-oxoacyl-[acyl-carrier protein] reductase [Myxococcales bacterium]